MALITQGVQALKLTDVWKSFDGVDALKGVTFEAQAGEVHALLGENGAGKSTLMAIAAGALAPDSGSMELKGELVRRPLRCWCASAGCRSPTSTRRWSPTSPSTRTWRCGCPPRPGRRARTARPGRRLSSSASAAPPSSASGSPASAWSSASCSRSPSRWPPTRPCSSWTSRPPRSAPRRPRRCSPSCGGWPTAGSRSSTSPTGSPRSANSASRSPSCATARSGGRSGSTTSRTRSCWS